MLIQKACETCGLTKKALEYYEAKGLIAPRILDNGYRDYSEKDIRTLREISVLRKCGVGVDEIKTVLASKNKAAALAKCRYVTGLRMERLRAVQRCMDSLISDYDVERAFASLAHQEEDLLTVKEKLVFAFPGNYGMFLSFHFGRFLDGVVDTAEKRRAYNEIVGYLDDLELELPPELAGFLEEVTSGAVSMEALESTTNAAMLAMLDNTEEYLAAHRQEIEAYHALLRSDEYTSSPAAAMRNGLREFQSQSGYREKLVENMRVLSPAYAAYHDKLLAANEAFFRHFPQSEDIYGL